MPSIHLWLRAESKENEQRTHLTPEKCQELLQAGKKSLATSELTYIKYRKLVEFSFCVCVCLYVILFSKTLHHFPRVYCRFLFALEIWRRV